VFNPQPPMPQGDVQQTLDWWEQIANSPMGQQANQAMQQTIGMNVKIANAQLKNAAAQIAIQKGQAAADKWYKEQQVKLAQQAHQLAVKTQQQNYELSVGGLTGQFNGQPTMAYQGMQAGYTGMWNGQPTLQNQNQQQQFGLQQGQLTGLYNGAPTLAALMNSQNFGLNQAGVTGYYNGQATMNREQQAANAALSAAQIGASLRGPGDWAQYLQAMNGIAGSPASALVASAPGGMGQAAGNGGGPVSLAQVLGQAGVMPGQGGSQPGAWQPPASWGGGGVVTTNPVGPVAEPNPQQWAGGTPGFNEGPLQTQAGIPTKAQGGSWSFNGQTGQWEQQDMSGATLSHQASSYSSAPANRPRGTNPVGPHGSGGGPRTGSASTDNGGGGMAGGFMVQNPDGTWSQGGSGTTQQQQAGGTPITPSGIGIAPGPTGHEKTGSGSITTQQGAGWNPYSLTGAIGQVAAAPRVTNAQLGLTDDEAKTLQNAFRNPHQMAGTWWSSKSADQKAYLGGLNEYWGGSNTTFQEKERNSRPRQSSPFAAV
jgi:hypothetical protein